MANAKLDVDIGSFVSNINTAKGVLKGLNAEMKATEAEFKATGNAEDALQKKTKTLNRVRLPPSSKPWRRTQASAFRERSVWSAPQAVSQRRTGRFGGRSPKIQAKLQKK